METKRQSKKSFCGRPGCGVARAVHHILARACESFVEPGSKEAHELRRAHLVLVTTPVPEAIEDEPTVKVRTLSDAELFAEWKSRLTEVLT